jgi:hypothetical protein
VRLHKKEVSNLYLSPIIIIIIQYLIVEEYKEVDMYEVKDSVEHYANQ